MIKVRLLAAGSGGLYGFVIKGHGSETVCAAVSALAQNAVNSIEKFTGLDFKFNYKKSGGYYRFEHNKLKKGETASEASLLLNSLALGLRCIQDEYENEIEIKTEVYDG